MDVLAELRALGPKVDDVEKDIKSTLGQLSAVLARLDAGNIEERRYKLLMDERTRLSKEIEQLRDEKKDLRKKEEDLRARLPAPQQQGAAPPFLIFSKEKLGLSKIFYAVASCSNLFSCCSSVVSNDRKFIYDHLQIWSLRQPLVRTISVPVLLSLPRGCFYFSFSLHITSPLISVRICSTISQLLVTRCCLEFKPKRASLFASSSEMMGRRSAVAFLLRHVALLLLFIIFTTRKRMHPLSSL